MPHFLGLEVGRTGQDREACQSWSCEMTQHIVRSLEES